MKILNKKNKSKKIDKKVMKKTKTKKVVLIAYALAFFVGLALSVMIFNKRYQAKEQYLEVTFIDPHQALIFWKTENESVGFVRRGDSKRNRDQIIYQTNSNASNIHAVVLDEIPLEGVYISLHEENESSFIFAKAIQVKFDPEKHDNGFSEDDPILNQIDNMDENE